MPALFGEGLRRVDGLTLNPALGCDGKVLGINWASQLGWVVRVPSQLSELAFISTTSAPTLRFLVDLVDRQFPPPGWVKVESTLPPIPSVVGD